jgi:murein DD-endopeptidase MepM/ murein hydrolase activator NlpD
MQEYIVKAHDSLWKIAKEHGTTVSSLAAVNGLKGEKLHDISIGQKLLLPDGNNSDPDTLLTLKFRGIDTEQFTPKKIRVAFDGKTQDATLNSGNHLKLSIFDHSKGLKVWIENLEKEMVLISETAILPIGIFSAAIDSRKLKVSGNMLPEKGTQESSKSAAKKDTTTQAQQVGTTTVQQQVRTEGGEPVHALATIYTKENLRLDKGNEKYRDLLIAAATKYSLTPQSVAAMIDAEAAKKAGAWDEKSNEGSSDAAQGLGQFFIAAWSAVSKDPKSTLSQDSKGLSDADLMKKALEAKYAIDGVASYAVINMSGFEKASGLSVSSLPPEEKAKVAYLLHHEGITGLQRLMNLPCSKEPYTNDQAIARLRGQIGKKNEAKLQQILAQYDMDGVKAYRGWLFSYCDIKINVNHFIVQDAEKLASTPRSIADIMAQVCGQTPTPKPKPRPAAPAAPAKSADKPAAAKPQPQPAPASTNNAATSSATAAPAAGGAGQWVDPLAVCTLRTGHLPSKIQAEFGMTRNNGHKAHQGIDLAAVPGTDILAVANGQVYVAPIPSPDYAYGNSLVLVVGINDLPADVAELVRKVNPGKTTIGFYYAHLSEFAVSPPYKNPYNVYAGEVIGKTGCTGNAKGMDTIELGAHLHFEVRLDARMRCAGLTNRTDPLPFIKNCTNR